MKVGILTFHNAYNYGAILQCYATQELVKSMGHEIEVIDYHNKKIDSSYSNRKFHWFTLAKRIAKGRFGYFLEVFFYRKRRKAYHEFIRNNIQLSKYGYYQGQAFSLDSYDVILIGSDQLWNKRITGGLDNVYWGDFQASNAKKIAWSVCMNNMLLTRWDKDYIRKNLDNFTAISVREDSLKIFLSEFTSANIYHTLDPTLLLPAKKWDDLCHKVKEKNYIAVYAVRKEKQAIEFAREISKILHKPLVIIRSYSKSYISSENKEYCGPADFLSYIKYADFVVSTSFHGTVFSLIFHKQFVCPSLEENTRISSLLKRFNLEDRSIVSAEAINSLSPIDYNGVCMVKESLKKESLDFLQNTFYDKK